MIVVQSKEQLEALFEPIIDKILDKVRETIRGEKIESEAFKSLPQLMTNTQVQQVLDRKYNYVNARYGEGKLKKVGSKFTKESVIDFLTHYLPERKKQYVEEYKIKNAIA